MYNNFRTFINHRKGIHESHKNIFKCSCDMKFWNKKKLTAQLKIVVDHKDYYK